MSKEFTYDDHFDSYIGKNLNLRGGANSFEVPFDPDDNLHRALKRLNRPHIVAIAELMAKKISADDPDRIEKGRRRGRLIQANQQLFANTIRRPMIPPPGDDHIPDPTPATGFRVDRIQRRVPRKKIAVTPLKPSAPAEPPRPRVALPSNFVPAMEMGLGGKSWGETPSRGRRHKFNVPGLALPLHDAIKAVAKAIGRSIDQTVHRLLDEAVANHGHYQHCPEYKVKDMKTRDLSVRDLPDHTHEAIKRIADEEGRSKAATVRKLLSEALYARRLVNFVRTHCPE